MSVVASRRMAMKIRSNIKGYIDRRGPRELEAARVIEQERADLETERRYRQAVANNWKERARLLGVPRAWLSPRRGSAPLHAAAPVVTSRQAE